MDDYATVISVWLEAGLQLSSSDSRNGLKQKLMRDPDLFLVAEEENMQGNRQIVGIVMGGYDGRCAWIYHLAVLPDHQGRGIGRQLLEEVEQRLFARGCERISLFVEPTNHSAFKFY
ncbi:MAG TPA: GNAT family N-acetyltransferase [Ktedonobacteraceae bacterium]|nr:GNAT family N-acetyltransferase [Ktedonobacteraceae bacterium]